MASDPQTRTAIETHDEWLGFVQPVGLVVAPPVLVERGVIIDRNIRPHQERLDALLNDDENAITDIRSIFVELLGWEEDDLADPDPGHHIRLPELAVTLEPHWQVKDRDGAAQLLIRCEPEGSALAEPSTEAIDDWTASPQARFERLLRETGIPTGLLCTPEAVRPGYAPAGETSGHVTFRIADMAQVMAGRYSPPSTCCSESTGCSEPSHANASARSSPRAARRRTSSRPVSPARSSTRCMRYCAASSPPMLGGGMGRFRSRG